MNPSLSNEFVSVLGTPASPCTYAFHRPRHSYCYQWFVYLLYTHSAKAGIIFFISDSIVINTGPNKENAVIFVDE